MRSSEPADLSRLLLDTVSDIEPRAGIEAIRTRITPKESPMAITRTWILGTIGAAAATAAVITGVVVISNNSDSSSDADRDPAAPSRTATDEPSSGDPSETSVTSTPPVTE